MEMEKINDNTIRVLLANEDLTERRITVLDLLGNHKDIESFFYEILEEVDKNHEFRDTEAVTFQVMPDRNGLELFITKINPEELSEEAREFVTKDQAPGIKRISAADTPLQDDVSEFLKNELMKEFDVNGEEGNELDEFSRVEMGRGPLPETTSTPAQFVYAYADFKDVINLANAMPFEYEVGSDLYSYQNAYYVILTIMPEEFELPSMRDDLLALVSEYGVKQAVAPEVLKERGQLIMENHAFELVRHYFN